MVALEPFQLDTVERLIQSLSSGKSPFLQSATGSGKTYISAETIRRITKDPNEKILILVGLQVLIGQTYETLLRFNLVPSVLHDEVIRRPSGEFFNRGFDSSIVITMPETLINTRLGRNQLAYQPDWIPTKIWRDEAHKSVSTEHQTIQKWFENSRYWGTSATPFRPKNDEGESLQEWYNELITTISIDELIKIGRLVRPVYYSFDENSHPVNTWIELTSNSKNKKTIIFTKDTRHSLALKEAFLSAKIKAEIITSGSELDGIEVSKQTPLQRQDIFNSFNKPKGFDVLISVMALAEGFDCPIAKFAFIQRSIQNHALWHQIIGRILRAHPSKDCGVVADFYGNIGQHGPIENYKWSLESSAPNTLFLRKNDEITYSEYTHRDRIIMVRCGCNHVFNHQKYNGVCSYCKTHIPLSIITPSYIPVKPTLIKRSDLLKKAA